MRMYIPESELNNTEHMQQILDILGEVPDTDLRWPGIVALDDAIQKIRELGEDKIADLLYKCGAGF
ncbi:MAG: hypothetical protein NC489_33635 [Ruminococcus flavefaciens]|nr:hypothetical protein [Ruminococcus flavefaciens]